MNKQSVFTVLFLGLLFSTAKAIGQFTTTRETISTPYGKASIPTMQYRLQLFYYGNQNFDHPVYKLHIIFQNNSAIEVKASINIADSIINISWKKKGQKNIIKPSETKEIFRIDDMGKKLQVFQMTVAGFFW